MIGRALLGIALGFGLIGCSGSNDAASPAPGAGGSEVGGAGGAPAGGAGGSGAATDAGGNGGEAGTPDVSASCDGTGTPRAVVLAISGADEIDVLTQIGGTLVDHGIKFTSVQLPQHVAMRADGKEAVVAWGDIGSAYGLATITLSPDGTTASLSNSIQLGADRGPESVDYVTNDRLIYTVAGPKDEVITLDRKDGNFAETTRTAAPGAFAMQVARRPGTDEALLLRWDSLSESVSHVHRMTSDGSNAFEATGTPGVVDPASILMAVHPNGQLVYSTTSNPKDPISETDLTTTGYLRSFSIGAAGLTPQPDFLLPRLGSTFALDPAGHFLVAPGADYEWDPNTGTPVVRNYALVTVPLDSAGAPQPTLPESPKFPALLFWDLAVTQSGHLLLSINEYQGSVPPDQETPLELRAQTSPGQWTVCQTLYLPGGASIAVAP